MKKLNHLAVKSNIFKAFKTKQNVHTKVLTHTQGANNKKTPENYVYLFHQPLNRCLIFPLPV